MAALPDRQRTIRKNSSGIASRWQEYSTLAFRQTGIEDKV